MNASEVVCFVLYRILQRISAFLLAVSSPHHTIDSRKCESYKILCRKKYCLGDIARPCDFLLWNRNKIDVEEVKSKPSWSLYTVSTTHAYFVRLPGPIENYQARQKPFLYIAQFQEAEAVAKLSIRQFLREFVDAPPCNLSFITMAYRSGSTLLTQMMQADAESVRAYSEPDAFTMAGIYEEEKIWTPEMTREVIRASAVAMCKDQGSDIKTTVMKLNSSAARVLPHLRRSFPTSTAFHVTRELESALIASDRCLRTVNYSSTMLWAWHSISPGFAEWLTPLARCHGVEQRRLRPQTDWDMAFFYLAMPHVAASANSALYSHPLISYKELIDRNTIASLLESVYSVAGLPLAGIPEGVNCLERDSQAGTPYEKKQGGKEEAREPTFLDRKEVAEMGRRMGLDVHLEDGQLKLTLKTIGS